ncbi:hypothetical protein T484DRAFT_1950589 [Baffinella frigidus]|nr:hypothetical protein T484DRAFT_1950589 [Cryptophyta sp. CCMP2293]
MCETLERGGCRHCKDRALADAAAETARVAATAAAEKVAGEKAAVVKAAAEKAALHKAVSAEKAALHKAVSAEIAAAAEKQARRDTASQLDTWLREMCEIVDTQERTAILDLFVDPRYMVDSTPILFALEEEDMDAILASLSLGRRRLVKRAWLELRPPRRGGSRHTCARVRGAKTGSGLRGKIPSFTWGEAGLCIKDCAQSSEDAEEHGEGIACGEGAACSSRFGESCASAERVAGGELAPSSPVFLCARSNPCAT